MKHRGSFLHRMDATHASDRHNKETNERTDGRTDSPSFRLLDGVDT